MKKKILLLTLGCICIFGLTDCVYNIILTWNEENIDTNGFFGKAEYIFKTK